MPIIISVDRIEDHSREERTPELRIRVKGWNSRRPTAKVWESEKICVPTPSELRIIGAARAADLDEEAAVLEVLRAIRKSQLKGG